MTAIRETREKIDPHAVRADIDLSAVRAALGQKIVEHDEATAAPLRGMVVTFDRDERAPEVGEPIAPGWHLAYFPDASRLAELGADGLPLARGVLPAMPLPRRMYAGARLTFHAPILVGDTLTRESEFSDVQLREGSTGVLILATLTRRFFTPRGLALTDEQHTVFREAVPPGAPSGVPRHEAPPSDTQWQRTIVPDPVSLFRYSALTFNGYRIHYDQRFATEVQGHPGLVVHAPLVATLLADLLRRNLPEASVSSFSFRAITALYDTGAFFVSGRPDGDGSVKLWARDPGGALAVEATARLEPPLAFPLTFHA